MVQPSRVSCFMLDDFPIVFLRIFVIIRYRTGIRFVIPITVMRKEKYISGYGSGIL